MNFVNVQGEEIPALGLGTWQITGPACQRAVTDALDLGYRHIDTAQAYDNEKQVGEGIAESDVDRDEIFLTTKVWHKNLTQNEVIATTEQSLRKLGTDYVDLLLVHWPVDDVPFKETFDAMRHLRNKEKVRHLGVSNFPPGKLEEALDYAPLLCNQVEYHPYLAQDDLLEMCRANDMMLTAYSPLARGHALRDATLQEIGEAHDKSPAQVILRWLIQQENVAAIPKASSHQHRVANLDLFDFELTDDEMATVHDLDRSQRIIDPSFAPEWEN